MINRSNNNNKERPSMDFSKIKVGKKTLENAIIDLSPSIRRNKRYRKEDVERALLNNDYKTLRLISNEYFKISGIYSRLCRYLAYLYRYDYLVTPYIEEDRESLDSKKLLKIFFKILNIFEKFQVKKFLSETALKVIKNGCYYGYVFDINDTFSVQELPPEYCRVRFYINSNPAVEFNLKYFDTAFPNLEQRLSILKLFPDEFRKAYLLYKENKLPPAMPGEAPGWYLLDVEHTIKFNMNGSDVPLLMSVIPAIMDLEDAQDLDRERMRQKLLKIIIQKMPLDKNGDLIFDTDEVEQMHKNAVGMLSDAIGVDILTTFADVEVADMADKNTTTSVDELEKIERTVYNEAGVSQMQFNTDGNIALQKSILNDEAMMYNLVLQYDTFLNMILNKYNINKKYRFSIQVLRTTIYNYQEMSKFYENGMKLGYSKMISQIALGVSQSSILSNAYFENDVLDLINVFIPPLSSNVMNAEALAMTGNKTAAKVAGGETEISGTENESTGRPKKSDDEKSEKTIQNQEAIS